MDETDAVLAVGMEDWGAMATGWGTVNPDAGNVTDAADLVMQLAEVASAADAEKLGDEQVERLMFGLGKAKAMDSLFILSWTKEELTVSLSQRF